MPDTTKNTLLIRKTGEETVYSSFGGWNIACTEVPFEIGGEPKEPYKNDWKDEHGEDTYIPNTLVLKAYDMRVKFAYKGAVSSAYGVLTAFRDFLIGVAGTKKYSGGTATQELVDGGASLDIYFPYTGIGRQKCYLKQFADSAFTKSNIDDVLEFSAVFRVTDPLTSITLTDEQ